MEFEVIPEQQIVTTVPKHFNVTFTDAEGVSLVNDLRHATSDAGMKFYRFLTTRNLPEAERNV